MISDKDLYRLTQPDVYALICEGLYALKDYKKYSTISELSYLLDRESFIKLIKYFGGMTVEIPTLDEFKDTIKLRMLYQAVEVDKLPWRKALDEAGYDLSQSRSAQRKLAILKKTVNSFKEGGRKYD